MSPPGLASARGAFDASLPVGRRAGRRRFAGLAGNYEQPIELPQLRHL